MNPLASDTNRDLVLEARRAAVRCSRAARAALDTTEDGTVLAMDIEGTLILVARGEDAQQIAAVLEGRLPGLLLDYRVEKPSAAQIAAVMDGAA